MVSGSWSSDHAIDLRMDLPDLDSYRNLTSSSSSALSRKKFEANFNFFDRSDFDFLKLIRNFFWFTIFFFSKVGRGRIHHQLNIISHIVSLYKKYPKMPDFWLEIQSKNISKNFNFWCLPKIKLLKTRKNDLKIWSLSGTNLCLIFVKVSAICSSVTFRPHVFLPAIGKKLKSVSTNPKKEHEQWHWQAKNCGKKNAELIICESLDP